METKTKIILATSLLAAAGIGVTLYFVLRKKSDIIDTTTSDSDSGTTSAPGTTPTPESTAPGTAPTGQSKIKREIALVKAKAAGNLKYPPPRFKADKKRAYKNFVMQKMAEAGFSYVGN